MKGQFSAKHLSREARAVIRAEGIPQAKSFDVINNDYSIDYLAREAPDTIVLRVYCTKNRVVDITAFELVSASRYLADAPICRV